MIEKYFLTGTEIEAERKRLAAELSVLDANYQERRRYINRQMTELDARRAPATATDMPSTGSMTARARRP